MVVAISFAEIESLRKRVIDLKEENDDITKKLRLLAKTD